MREPTVEDVWMAHGLECMTLRMPIGHPCGYVKVPDAHPWHGVGYSDRVPGLAGPVEEYHAEWGGTPYELSVGAWVEVHGGITHAGRLHTHGGDGWWFGFDCAHAGDWSTWEPDGRVWGARDLRRETTYLAAQLANAPTLRANKEGRHDR